MEMLSCNLDRSSEIPLYEQLYQFIRNEIVDGRIHYKDKLPSKRKLSDFLQISLNTVEAAYGQLAAEGYVEVIPKKGYFVLKSEDLEYVKTDDKRMEKPTNHERDFRFHFHPTQIDSLHFPFQQWRKYLKNIVDEQNHSLLLLGDPQGEMELRAEISHYLYEARGVQCSPEQIVIGAGSETLLHQLIVLFKKDTVYGVEDPGFHLIQQILRSYPNKVVPLKVDSEGININHFPDSPMNVVYVTPARHFPFGTVLPVNRRAKLLNWAVNSEDRYIIEDDYDSEFRYSGKSIPSLQSMDKSGKVIYLGSFSKSLMPSIRISYMVLPKPLLKKYKEKLSFYHSTVSRIDQQVLAQFMANGDFERHLNRMRKVYRRKLAKVEEMIKPYKWLRVVGERSGLHIVLEIDRGMDEMELVTHAEEKGCKIYPLSYYSFDEVRDKLPKIILGFAGIPEEDLDEALATLIKAWVN